MSKRFILAAVLVLGTAIWFAVRLTEALPRMIQAADGRTRLLVAGQKGPVIVLESFGEMPLDFWGTIQWRCARFGRVVSYDHRDTGGSDPGLKPRHAPRIAQELHAALHAAHLDPPYLLVGYSFGGPYVRVFTDLYPAEVSGMVLIDPSQEEFFDWLKVHRPDANKISPSQAAEQGEFGSTWLSLEAARASRLPAVPLTLITAQKPFGEKDPRLRPEWLASHQRWLSRIPGARHIVTQRSDHGIIWEEPDLIVKTIHDLAEQIELSARARR